MPDRHPANPDLQIEDARTGSSVEMQVAGSFTFAGIPFPLDRDQP